MAEVSEGNIFRYFPTKRDLFLAAIDSELQKLSVRAEVLAEITNAEDSRTALRSLLQLIAETVAWQPELVRLLYFSALGCGPQVQPTFCRYVTP